MQHVEAFVGGDSVLSGSEYAPTVTLTIFLLPHNGVISYVAYHARNECVIAFVHVHRERQALSDAGHARCNTKTFWLQELK
jgi:hypothetical protein